MQNGLCRNDDRASAHKISEQQAEEKRHGAVLQHSPRAVAMRHVAELVSDDASDLVGTFGFVDQAVEDIDNAPKAK